MLPNIFDSHSHYDSEQFSKEGREIVKKLFEDGLSGIIHAGTDLESSRFGIALSKEFDKFYTSVGFHPEYASNVSDEDLKELASLSDEEKVVAIGEIGLDYHYEGYDREKQIYIFEEQLKLAKKKDLPVIIHSRDATEDTMAILKKYRPKGVLHCFSGSAETAKEVLALGMYIGFTGVVTFKNAKKAISVLEILPLDRLLLETDCPYMAPEPFRGKRCQSDMIEFTAKKAAEVMGVGVNELLAATEDNVKRLFRI